MEILSRNELPQLATPTHRAIPTGAATQLLELFDNESSGLNSASMVFSNGEAGGPGFDDWPERITELLEAGERPIGIVGVSHSTCAIQYRVLSPEHRSMVRQFAVDMAEFFEGCGLGRTQIVEHIVLRPAA